MGDDEENSPTWTEVVPALELDGGAIAAPGSAGDRSLTGRGATKWVAAKPLAGSGRK
jgi:hypothetical protein